jgi:hypothetical protein
VIPGQRGGPAWAARVREKAVGLFADPAVVQKVVLLGAVSLLLLLLFPFLAFDILRIRYAAPIDSNEGWNAIHAGRVFAGEPLYTPLIGLPLIPVNYPPLSFFIIGAIGSLTGSPLLTGRVVSLVSLLVVAGLIHGMVIKAGSRTAAALLGALVWVALMVQTASSYVGMYDPQLFGHVFSLGALYLYLSWVDDLTRRRLGLLALLCCISLFIKHLLIPVPIALATALWFTNRRAFWTFALAGLLVFTLMLLGAWLYGGSNLFSNFIDLDRAASNARMNGVLRSLFVYHRLWVLFVAFIVFLFRYTKRRTVIAIYFPLSFVLGAYSSRGVSIGMNAWFDFFIASGLVVGMVAADGGDVLATKLRGQVVVYGTLLLCLVPFLHDFRVRLREVSSTEKLEQAQELYRKDVALLRSIPGDALYEQPLLGFDSGKRFLVDSFTVAQLMVSGRVPEKVLIDPIHAKQFGAVVLSFDLERKLAAHAKAGSDGSTPRTPMSNRWSDHTLMAIDDSYRLMNRPSAHEYFVYVPRGP